METLKIGGYEIQQKSEETWHIMNWDKDCALPENFTLNTDRKEMAIKLIEKVITKITPILW